VSSRVRAARSLASSVRSSSLQATSVSDLRTAWLEVIGPSRSEKALLTQRRPGAAVSGCGCETAVCGCGQLVNCAKPSFKSSRWSAPRPRPQLGHDLCERTDRARSSSRDHEHAGRAGTPAHDEPHHAQTAGRSTRGKREPPSDAEIERGLREPPVSDPRAAEILLRWLQRPRAEELVGGVDLDSMSERQLERLYAGLLRVAALPEEDLRALIASLLAETEDD
jgi:hypothetical protein